MSFSENANGNGMVMPVSPMGGYGAGNCGGFAAEMLEPMARSREVSISSP